jgi:hypothetical protein
MGHSSQSGQIIVRSQPTPGTFAADIATEGLAVRLRSGALAGNRELLVLDPEIGGGRDTADAYLGGVSFGGDYEMYPRFDSIPTFLRAALGDASSNTVTGVTTHTITPTDGQPPYLSVYEEIAVGLERFQYTDVMVSSLSFDAEANGFIMCTASVLGRLMTAGVADIDGSALYDLTPVAVGTNITVTYDGVTVPAKSLSLSISQDIEDDDFRLGSFYLGDMTAKQREISGSLTLRHNDALTMRQALFGTSAATQVGGLTTKEEMVITVQSYEDIPGGTPATKFKMEFTLPQVIYEPFAFEPSGDDILENDVSFRAVRPNPAVDIMSVEVVNGREDIA